MVVFLGDLYVSESDRVDGMIVKMQLHAAETMGNL
jgi:hypothetical protein